MLWEGQKEIGNASQGLTLELAQVTSAQIIGKKAMYVQNQLNRKSILFP